MSRKYTEIDSNNLIFIHNLLNEKVKEIEQDYKTGFYKKINEINDIKLWLNIIMDNYFKKE